MFRIFRYSLAGLALAMIFVSASFAQQTANKAQDSDTDSTITEKGFTRDYFGDDAFYCDPASPQSIFDAVDKAAHSASPIKLQERVLQNYTWQRAASITLETCKNII